MMNYGIPYQGSKSRIAKDIIRVLPQGKRFVDLFAGGCAVAHAALLSGKYEKVLVNDFYPDGTNIFKQALEGEFSKPEYFRWVSREEFLAKKETDPFVRFVFSFGNGGQTYMYSKELEPLKKGFHYAVVYDDWSYLEKYAKDNNWREGLLDSLKKSVEGVESVEQRRLATEREAREEGLQSPTSTFSVHLLRRKRLDEINERRLKITKPAYDSGVIGLPHNLLQNLERKNRLDEINERRLKLTKPAFDNGIIGCPCGMLQNIDRISRLQNLEQLTEPDIDFTSFDYKDYQHEEGDVVYCDPPYKGTWKYNGREFNHDAFYDWVRTRDYPVYFSEYSAPQDFISIWQKGIPKRGNGGKSAVQQATEHLYLHSKWLKNV